MAAVAHTPDTLGLIVEDLRALANRLDALRADMEQSEVSAIGIDGERGQVNARTTIGAFIGAAETALRRAKDELYLKSRETSGRQAAARGTSESVPKNRGTRAGKITT